MGYAAEQIANEINAEEMLRSDDRFHLTPREIEQQHIRREMHGVLVEQAEAEEFPPLAALNSRAIERQPLPKNFRRRLTLQKHLHEHLRPKGPDAQRHD